MIQSQFGKDTAGYVRAHGVAQLFLWSAFYYLLPALFAQIAIESGWPVINISTTYTLAFLVWAGCAPIVGNLIDRGQGGKIIRLGAIVGIVVLIALSQVSNQILFSVLVVALGGCMAATLYDPCFAVMMRRLKHEGTNAVATVTLIAGFATLLTFPLVIGLSLVFDWQQIVLVFAALAGVGLMFLPTEVEAVSDDTEPHTKMPIDKGPVLIALSFGLVMMGHAILLFLLPVALAGAEGNKNVALLALAILGPSQIVGRMAWKYYGAAYSPQNCAVLMFACFCLPASLLLVFGAMPSIVYAALIIQGMCYGVHTILRPGLAQRFLRSAHLGRGLGTIATVGLIMMAVGPVVGGVVWTYLGMAGLMGTILVLNLLALSLGVILHQTIPKDGAA